MLLFQNLNMIDFSLSHPVMTLSLSLHVKAEGASLVLMQWKMNKGKYGSPMI